MKKTNLFHVLLALLFVVGFTFACNEPAEETVEEEVVEEVVEEEVVEEDVVTEEVVDTLAVDENVDVEATEKEGK